MTMMRIRGVWTTNLVAFLLGSGHVTAFLIIPQFAQLPKSTGFGFGASIVTAGLYLLPAALGMSLVGPFAGRVVRRYGSRMAVTVGLAITALAFVWLTYAPPPIRHADLDDDDGRRDRPRVRRAREPDRAGRAASADRRGQRHEYGHAHARGRDRGQIVRP